MKKKVTRAEAILIMRAAREFREQQERLKPVEVPESTVAPEEPPSQLKSIISYLVDIFRKKGT
jgi:hypothetical protein